VKKWAQRWNKSYLRPFGLRPFDEEDDSQNVLLRLIYGDRFSVQYRACESPLKSWLDFNGPRKKSLYKFVQWNVNLYLRDLRRATISVDTRTEFSNPGNPTDLIERNSEGTDALTLEERSQLRRCSSMCWQKLHPAHREMLELVGVMGHSQSEAAQRLGIAEATASRWIREAMKKFRACLRENCPEELLPFTAERH